jgi:hypothetical protein
MFAHLLLAQVEPSPVGWILFATGIATLAWAGYDYVMGETSIGDDTGIISRVIRRDQEPDKFRRTIIVVAFAGVICLAGSAFLLL